MADAQESQKEIFSKVQSLLAFLDTTEQKRNRENLEEWKDTFESLRNITNNPLPFLLELLKQLKSKKNPGKSGADEKAFRAAKKKNRKGLLGDGEFKETTKQFAEKYNLDVSSDTWLRTLNQIIRQSILTVLPRVDDILYEEIVKAFNCDLSMFVPVVGDGLSGPIQIDIAEVDILKNLFNDPNSDVGKYMYESAQLDNTPGVYPPGQTPHYPLNRFLRDIIFNGGAGVSNISPGNTQTVYGASGRALFDITASAGVFTISPYYKIDPSQTTNYKTAPNALVPGATKFTIVEFLKDYFGNIRLIEMQNFLGALMEILTGFMSVRNQNFSIEDLLGLQKLMSYIENILESCDGADLDGPDTESVSHLSELYDDDSFFEFNVEEERNIKLEVKRKSQNVISLVSCGSVDIPVDNGDIDEGVNDILATQVIDEQIKAFDLVLQKAASSSAAKAGYDISLGSISLPVEIDFKENLIKKLPQILVYSILNPKGVLPIVLTSKLLNQNGTLASSVDLFAQIFKRVIIRVVKEFLLEVTKHILTLVKNILLKLIRQLIKEKLSEQNKKKIRMIRRLLEVLLPLITALNNAKNCQEIFNILLTALSANMPDVPFGVPPFLVSAAKLRPGTSSLGAFEKLINKLQSQGIPVGDMPDGSPNVFLLSQFSLIQAMDEEMSDNGAVSSVILNGQVITPLGPGMIVPFTTADGIVK